MELHLQDVIIIFGKFIIFYFNFRFLTCKCRPDALLLGTDHITKHDEPQLPWNGFFTIQGFLNGDKLTKEPSIPDYLAKEFEYIPLAGHVFKEVLFYHKPSKSLTGLTDMMVSTKEFIENVDKCPWMLSCYFFALGLYRTDLPAPVATQSYHLLFTTNKPMLRSCAAQLFNLDVEHMTMGHGGIYHGKENCDNVIKSGFRWVFNHEYSLYQSLIIKIMWAKRFGFPF